VKERTPEDRERARLEREAKRRGQAPPTDVEPVVPPFQEPEPVRDHELAVTVAEPEPTPAEQVQHPAWLEGEPFVPDPDPDPEPVPADDVGSVPTAESPLEAPEPQRFAAPESERPLGVRRAGVPSVKELPDVGNAYQRYKAKPRGVPKGRRGMRRVAPVVGLVLLIPVAWFLISLFQPFKGDGDGAVSVTVPAGSSSGQVGDLLAERDVIGSSFFFSLRARMAGADLKSGTFQMRHSMSYGAAIDQLTSQPGAAPVVKVVVPEGRSRGEIADIAEKAGLTGDYAAASRSSSKLRPRSYGAPRKATLEGFLWPATYEVEPKSSARSLVTKQLAAFKDNFDGLSMASARRRNLTRYDVLIVASMIEREGKIPSERAKIAAVIYNRLRRDMPLGIDATIRFSLNNWSQPLKQSELQRDTPYNTRTRTGLPPGPIGNPGLASIKAALKPAKVDYLFYVVKPCGEGAHAFATSQARADENVAAYNKARNERGGKDPSNC
jgi:UPF0755 protein